jgi:zinc/manganese transport system substrate-binding protein
MIRRCRIAALVVLAAMFAAAPASAQDKHQDKLRVVASISIIGDLVKNVGGDRLDVVTLIGPNSDAHVFSPTPSDAKTLGVAKAVFINGMGLEGWITRLIAAAGTKTTPIVVSAGITPRQADEGGHHAVDPHAWQSVANVKIYVANIRNGLKKADPAGDAAYDANAKAYLGKLDALERELRESIGKIPPERRKIITTHDAFGYLAEAYDMTVAGFVVPNPAQEPSAEQVRKLTETIRNLKVRAVFLEPNLRARSSTLVEVAKERGVRVCPIYGDAFDDAVNSYVELLRFNADSLKECLS